MNRMTFDEEGNVCRFLSSILDNEGKLIILEEQYQDFYKYVLLPILSYFEVFDETSNDIPTYDEIKIYGDIDDNQMIYFNQFMLMKIKIVFMALMIILLQLINKILLKNILNNMLLL